MDILVIAEKKSAAKPIVSALEEKGANAKYIRLSKIALVTKKNSTTIKSFGRELPEHDAVFIQARASLAPFIEPLLEELHNIGAYTNAKRGSYYVTTNEPYLFVTLTSENIPTPRTMTSGSAKNLEKISKKISYPIIAKYFVGKKVQQAIILNNSSELNLFSKSIRTETDGFMIREYIKGDAISCIIIGKKICGVKRKERNGIICELSNGETYKPSEEEQEIISNAARAVGLDIARIDLVKGKIVKIDTIIPWNEFNKICSERLEEQVATFIIEKARTQEWKRKEKFDFLGIRKLLLKTPLGELFK